MNRDLARRVEALERRKAPEDWPPLLAEIDRRGEALADTLEHLGRGRELTRLTDAYERHGLDGLTDEPDKLRARVEFLIRWRGTGFYWGPEDHEL